MKTKLIIIALFMCAFGVCYYQYAPSETKKETICKVDTVQIVANYFMKYEDSRRTALRCYNSTDDIELMKLHGANYERLDSTYDALITKAGMTLTADDFEKVIVKVVDSRNYF